MTINLNCSAATLSERNTVSFDSDFNQKSVTKLKTQILKKHLLLEANEEIKLVIFSPGGSIIAGNSLIQFMNDLDRRYTIICKFCASMAFHTFQGVENAHRFLTSDGILMTHKASGGFAGSFPGQVDAIYNLWLNIIKKMDTQVVKKTNGNHTMESYIKLYSNDYWCSSADCIKQGFADSVVPVSCDKSLGGLKSKVISFFGQRIRVYENKCPLIRGIVDYKILNRHMLDSDELQEIDNFINLTNTRTEVLMLSQDGKEIKRINELTLK
jgi:ATP-dependent protease ClpP protease subunit